MKTRIIHTRIWQDGWFTSITRSSRLLFIYLLTCESNNICGIFEIPDRNILFDTGLNQSELDQAKKDLKEKVIFYEGWIKILNTEKYNNYVTNPKLEKAFNRELSVVPSKTIEYMNKYDTSIDTSIYTINNHKSKTINQKSKIKKDKTYTKENLTIQQVAEKLITHFETENGRKSKLAPNSYKNLAYWLEVYEPNEIAQAISQIKYDSFWKDKMDLTILFRQSSKGEPVNWIDTLLNKQKENYARR